MTLAYHESSATSRQSRLLARIRQMGPLSIVLWILLLLISAVLIIYPIGVAIGVELPNLKTGLAELVSGELSRTLPAAIMNTVIVVTGATAIALVIGSALAWANERTDASLGFIGQLLPLAALIVPPVAGVIGWAVLLDPRAGLLNFFLRAILEPLGINLQQGPFNIYSMTGLIVVTGLYTVPYVYLIVSAALQRLDPSVEEAARVSGAGPFKTTLKVTLPAIRPALAASVLLGFISGVSLFSVPAVLGGGAKIDVLSVYIYRLLSEYPAKTGPALILALGLLVTVQMLLLAQGFVVKRGRNATISGKGMRATPVRLGAMRHLVLGLAIFYLLMTAILPILGLGLVSLQPFWTPSINWSVLSLKNFQTVLFDNRQTVQALFNSMMLGCAVATCNMLLTGAIALHFSKSGLMRKLVDGLTGLPATIPHTVIGVAFILAFSHEPLRIYGTTTILFLAYIVMTITYAARSAAAAADSIGAELGEASRVSKATDIVTLWKILLPLAIPGIVAGWIMVFVHTVGEVTASAFLSGPRNPVIGRVLLDFWNFGNFPQVAALALVISTISASLVGAMLFVTRRSRDATTH
ncbi:iron ABC transporter permease [Rhizobium sp. SSA_523]|uniref:ABC transporter permease n=1 Tax=Rhizobium sp. SSA_523 TaxID=2952477 RepID=UPI002091858B|nr:iron ABC transporter permease [Rhizobium sp. SSA_523]MCO5731588.1 iron ABC transporter permease [Rhizobium sp. SSA_523]WKC21898.1 iron ABC transporter permease [Rhizobium sp. SSA_523]